MPSKAISTILAGVVKVAKENDDDDLKGALHTHIVNKLFDAQDKHGEDQYDEWHKTINEIF